MKALKGLFNRITPKFGLEIKERSIYNLQQRGLRAQLIKNEVKKRKC